MPGGRVVTAAERGANTQASGVIVLKKRSYHYSSQQLAGATEEMGEETGPVCAIEMTHAWLIFTLKKFRIFFTRHLTGFRRGALHDRPARGFFAISPASAGIAPATAPDSGQQYRDRKS